jgi:hypothetical protein
VGSQQKRPRGRGGRGNGGRVEGVVLVVEDFEGEHFYEDELLKGGEEGEWEAGEA